MADALSPEATWKDVLCEICESQKNVTDLIEAGHSEFANEETIPLRHATASMCTMDVDVGHPEK